MKNIPFSPPYIDSDVIDEVTETLTSGWITSGPKVKALEESICEYSGVKHCICVNSWTSGAILVLKWFGIKEGDEVIIPAYTYSATALAVLHCGATPVIVDITDDFNVDVSLIEKAITPRTKVIIPVDFAGWPCDYDAINALVNPESEKQNALKRILVIADAAHSFGAIFKGITSGKLTDISIFSLHAVKNITTAEGGAICLNLPSAFNMHNEYSSMKFYSLNGQSKSAYEKSQLGGWKYDILFAGLKVNMPDICAAIGLAQIRKYDSYLLKERERIAGRYMDFFKAHNLFQLPSLNNYVSKSSYHLFPLRVHNISEADRDLIINEISKFGISVNVHFIPLPMFTLFKDLGFSIRNFPRAYDNYSREISLPIYPQLTIGQVDLICKVVLDACIKVISSK